MYLVFSVRPYTKTIPRAVLKPPKVYFFDNGDVLAQEGARFENLVATSLLKRIHFLEDRDLPEAVSEVERYLIRKTLQRFAGNQTKTARALNISEAALRYKMKKYGFTRKAF